MQKQAPTIGRILVMATFTLSCFGLLLYLWSAFGGPVPLKPHGYRFHATFKEATQLAQEADVRISGVSVGRVKKVELSDEGGTDTTIELKDKYAPIPKDAHAILRQKTLLGETYVELTPGTKSAGMIPENGSLPTAHVAPTVELDEILRAFDPKTRAAFQTWQEDLGKGIDGHGQQFSDALGELPDLASNAERVVSTLNSQESAMRAAIKNTGVVFDALTERDGQLADWIANSNAVLSTTGNRDDSLRALFRVFPTFIDESSATLRALTAYANNTKPVLDQQLIPVARELSNTFKSSEPLASNFKRFFTNQKTLADLSKTGLPAASQFLDTTETLLTQLDPFLRNVNPFLDYLGLYKREIAALFANDTATLQATDQIGNNRVHYLRLTSPVNPEALSYYPGRQGWQRSNAYPQPGNYLSLPSGMPVFDATTCGQGYATFPNLGPPTPTFTEELRNRVLLYVLNSGNTTAPPCKQQSKYTFGGETTQYPHVREAPTPDPFAP
jgi:phospholipid/cholesterol/gamma-HCH transport system substrate-binding protein